ncbi:MAG: pre-peptidase C-terminal domain-containing protein [Caldilineaceae bacterium]|nr:pre-peptidase C-terminal domain-containing protein [Caldilineaceae bacterium]
MKPQVSLSFVATVAGLLVTVFLLLSQIALASAPASTIAVDWQQGQQPNAAPDLVIDRIILNPPNPAPGQSADITPVIKNLGDANAAGFSIHLYVDPAVNPPQADTPHTAQTFYGLGLEAGGTFDGYTRTGQPFSQANWTVCAWVDRGNQVAESNDNNNLLCIHGTTTGEPDIYEEDDLCPQAKEIATNGTVQERNLFQSGGLSDTDWISITAVSGVKYVAEAIAVGADADLYIELRSACDDPPSFGSGATITFTAPASGKIFLKIGHNQPNYGPNTAYQFKVTGQDACVASFEPNDMCSAPVDLAVGTAQTQSFCTQNDIDWSRFQVQAGGRYRVKTENTGSNANVQMSLFTSCEGASANNGQQIEFTAAAAGTIYLKTHNLDPNVFGANTEYKLEVELLNAGGCTEDSAEQDDVLADAKAITVDAAPAKRNTCPSGDVDWIKFTAQQGQFYTIETLNLADQADTILCLHAADGTQLRCDDDSGAGKGSRLSIENATAGDYYFKIRNINPDAAGDRTAYDVQVITGKCKNDALEPNNERGNAKAITINGVLQQHNICAEDDVDWVTFTAAANTSYVISTTALGPEADTEIELYDPNGNLLARNDDFTPGVQSQLGYNITTAGTYAIKVQHYNQQRYGAGTEYGVSVRTGATPTPTPTQVPGPTPTPTPTPQGGSVRTLILVNHARLTQLYDADSATQVLNKLNALAQRDEVKGEILRLDNNTEISAAYGTWLADLTNVDKANQLANEIRRLVMNYLAERGGVEYVVLVGDDRALPFRRVADNTPRQSEKSYADVDATHPTGAALRANFFLTDDFYVDREPTSQNGREVYIPDLAIGRLIETPQDMIATIDAFLAQPTTSVERVLVTGYDFVQDTAQGDCTDWKQALSSNPNNVACLISPSWAKQEFTNLQFSASPAFKVQSINGHANHFAQGAAGGGSTSASEVLAASMDLTGGLIYTLGCHGGLNVPPSNSTSPLDLAEAFTRKGANYIGNTGYGWGLLNSVGLSEKVIRLFTKELLKAESVAMGKALAKAKSLYFEQDQSFSAYDEKVMQQLTFYGLPMFHLAAGGSASLSDDFPGVDLDFDPSGSLDGSDVITKPVRINFQKVLDDDPNNGELNTLSTDSGQYLSLYGSINADADEPVQPLHFGNVTVPQAAARSVVLLGATIASTTENFDPLVGTPVNEFVPRSSEDEATLDPSFGWYPPSPIAVTSNGGNSTLVTQLGQFNTSTNEQRLFGTLNTEVYYSTSTDQTPPDVLVVDGLYNPSTQRVNVKVGVEDASGMKEVIVSYVDNSTATTIKSVKLTFDASSQKWRGSFPGDSDSLFYIQAVDNAGNVSTASNKGNYYRPAAERASALGTTTLYLPVIRK